MRRKDLEKPKEFAWEVFDKAPFHTLSVVDGDEAYAIQLSCVRKGSTIYFHGAKEGKKVDLFQKSPKVYLSCATDVYGYESDAETSYSSGHFRGVVQEVLDHDEKVEVLQLITKRYTPKLASLKVDAIIERVLSRTALWKIVNIQESAKAFPLERK